MTAVKPPPLKTESVPVDKLAEHPRNYRKGDLAQIKRSLQTHGQYTPIVAQRSTGHVVVGNHRLRAARELGWTHINVVWQDIDDDQALELLAVDNRTSDLATNDPEQLANVLASFDHDTLESVGYTDGDLDELRRITGDLEDRKGSFLDDEVGDRRRNRDSTEPRAYLQLTYPVTAEQRQLINDALKKARAEYGAETSIEALVELCKRYKQGRLIDNAERFQAAGQETTK